MENLLFFGLLLIACAAYGIKAYLVYRSEILRLTKEAETKIILEREETKRLELLAGILVQIREGKKGHDALEDVLETDDHRGAKWQ